MVLTRNLVNFSQYVNLVRENVIFDNELTNFYKYSVTSISGSLRPSGFKVFLIIVV